MSKNTHAKDDVVIDMPSSPSNKNYSQMKFIVSSSGLLRQLQAISGVLNTNNPLPILDNFLFTITKGSLTISASDLETTMTTHLQVEARTEGKIAVPAKILLETLKTFPEQP